MADASDLFLPDDPVAGAVDADVVDPIESGSRAPFWSSSSASSSGGSFGDSFGDGSHPGDAADLFVPVFSTIKDPFFFSRHGLGSDSDDDEHDLSPFALDLFDRRRAADLFPDQPEGASSVDFGLGLGLGLAMGYQKEEEERELVAATAGFSDWATDDFFVGRRSLPQPSESIEFSRARPLGAEGLRMVGFDSDSDSEEQIVALGDEQISAVTGLEAASDLGPPLCWDCLQLDESQRDLNEDFEWEEVNERFDDRDVLSITVIGNGNGSGVVGDLDRGELERYEDLDSNVEWEVLMAVNNLGRNPMDPDDVEAYFVDDHEGLAYTSDYEVYEVLFGQFAEHDSNIKGSPPAAKAVVESLPSVILAKEEVANKDIVCAVCKDDILAEKKVKKLPCTHHYHEECILPWLGIRNTCPLCRFELPTDDPEYEKWKVRRAGNIVSSDEDRLGYDFEVLPEA